MDTQVSEVQQRVPVKRNAQPALAVALLIVLLLGVIGRFTGLDRVGASGLVVFTLVGPGAALVSFTRLPGGMAGRLCISFGLSVALLTGLSMATQRLDLWAPTPTLAVVSALAALTLVAAALRPTSGQGRHSDTNVDDETPASDEPPTDENSRLAGTARWWLAGQLLAVALCVVGALVSRTDNPPIGGFLRTINPIWYVGMVVLVVAATVVFFARNAAALGRFAPATTSLLLCSTVVVTPVLVYGTPRSQSAEKHVALSELIASTHELQASQTIYNDWPGLFTASAWLKDFAGIGDLVSLATWWPVLLIVFRLMAMRLLAGVFVRDGRMAWLASTAVFFATPGGIDYYSPQAIGYTIGLTILWLATSRATSLTRQCVLVFVLSCAVIVTHQLTPYIVGGALVVLAVFRQLRKWWLPAIVLVPTVAWTSLYFDQIKRFISPSTVGSTGNFTLPSQRATNNPGLLVNSAIGLTAIAVVVVGLFALVTLVRNYRSARVWGLAVASLVGFVAVFINAYGNEGTFRAVFFAVPWLAILAIMSISPLLSRRPRPVVWTRVASSLVAVLVPVSLVATYALDGSTVVRRGDRAFLNQLLDQSLTTPDRTTVVVSLGNADFPSVTASRVETFRVFRGTIAGLVKQTPPSTPGFATDLARQVAPLVSGRPGYTLYAFSSPAVNAYQDEYGQVTLRQSRQIVAAMEKSPAWTRTFDRYGTEGFRLNLAAIGG